MIRKFKMPFQTKGYSEVIRIPQYDTGYMIVFEMSDLPDGTTALDSYTATVEGVRSDGLAYEFNCTISGTTVSFEVDTTCTAVAGRGEARVRFLDGNDEEYAAMNFLVEIIKSPVPDGAVDADVETARTIQAEVQAIVDDAAETVTQSVADVYSPTSTYAAGDLVIYENALYKCTTAITTAEAWNASHWTATTIESEVEENASAISQLNADLTDIQSATKNLFDPSYLVSVAGWTKNDEEYIGTAIDLYRNFYANSNSYPIPELEEDTRYTLSFEAKTNGNAGTSGNGLFIYLVYSDTTTTGLSCPNATSDWTAFSVTSTANKTVTAIRFAYGSLSDNIWHLRKIQLEKGIRQTTYVPQKTAKDDVARDEIGNAESQIEYINFKQETGNEYLYGVFQNGGLTNGSITTYATYRVATDTIMSYDRDITLTIANGYKIGVHIFVNGVFSTDSGWKTGTYMIPQGTEFKCVITTISENTSVVADINTYVHAVTLRTFTQSQIDKIARADSISIATQYEKILGKHYVCHLGNPYYTGMIIPSQSRFDIERARKAGFSAIELNVQVTSDGKFVVGHGSGGNFGAEFYHVNNVDISNTAFNSVTLEYIKTYVRLNSAVEKYRVAPLTLEEALICAKTNGLIPGVSYTPATVGALPIAEKIMGKDNYIALVYTSDRPEGFNGVCVSWLSLTDTDTILAKCKASGGAYVAGINVGNEDFANFTLEDWKELTGLLHENGYRISTAYLLDPNLQHTLEKAGFDYVFTTYQIPEIENGNVCNLSDNNTFADFNHNGTVSGGKLVLASGQTVEPSETYPATLSSGGCLHVSFVGSIKVDLGSYINASSFTFTSDDDAEDWRFSSYFNGTAPVFKITASADTTISELSYKASRF